MLTDQQRTTLERFALDHKITLQDKGEVGFGRACVGFAHGDNYIDTYPFDGQTFKPLKGFGEEICEAAPENAYHKHDCLAVLVSGEDYEAALVELHAWTEVMNTLGVEIVSYNKNASPLQAAFTGATGYAVRVKS